MRCVLVGLSPLLSLGLKTALSKPSDSLDVGKLETVDLDRAVELARNGEVDLFILDPYCPTLSDGIKFCQQLKDLHFRPRILAFCDFSTERDLTLCFLAGIDSFISSQERPERLASVVESTLNGKREWIISPVDNRQKRDIDDLTDLTPRELEVLWMVSDRFTNAQIGRSLFISPNTVKNHVAAILRKLGVKRRSELCYGASYRSR